MNSPIQAPNPREANRPGQSEYSRKAALNVVNQPSGAATSAHDDPFANWLIETGKSLRESWQQAVVGILVVAAAVYFIQVFRTQGEQEGVEAAALFQRIGSDISQWRATKSELTQKQELNSAAKSTPTEKATPAVSADDLKKLQEDLDQQHTRIVEGLKALGDAQAPYPEMAQFYGTIMTIEQGDASALVGLLDSIQVDSVIKLSGRARMLAELKLLATARALLDSPENQKLARSALSRLASEGQYTAPVALMALARTAQSVEEKNAAREFLEKLPADQSEPIRSEVEVLTTN